MKQPRASDFDPSAGEYQLKSSMTAFPVIELPNMRPNDMPQQAETSDSLLQPVSTVPFVRDVPSVSSIRRKIKSRHPFDIYEDQLDELRKLSIEDRMRGGAGSMSAMVREALDGYLAKMRT